MNNSQPFFKFIRQLREENGLPLRKVAAELDLDPSTLSKIERGERTANLKVVDQLSHVFGIDQNRMRLIFLSDKIAHELWSEQNSNEILHVVEQKITYLRGQKK